MQSFTTNVLHVKWCTLETEDKMLYYEAWLVWFPHGSLVWQTSLPSITCLIILLLRQNVAEGRIPHIGSATMLLGLFPSESVMNSGSSSQNGLCLCDVFIWEREREREEKNRKADRKRVWWDYWCSWRQSTPYKLVCLFVSAYKCVCVRASWKNLFRSVFHATRYGLCMLFLVYRATPNLFSLSMCLNLLLPSRFPGIIVFAQRKVRRRRIYCCSTDNIHWKWKPNIVFAR